MDIEKRIEKRGEWIVHHSSDLFKKIELEITSAPVPRRVGLRPFSKGRKAWIELVLANVFNLCLMGLTLNWMIPSLAGFYGISTQGVVVDRDQSGGNYYLLVRYQSKDAKTHYSRIPVNEAYYDHCLENQVLDLDFLPWLPSQAAWAGDADRQTVPLALGPFLFLGYGVLYIFWFLGFRKEFRLFQWGQIVKGHVQSVSRYGAFVPFDYKGKDYNLRGVAYAGCAGDPVLFLIDPANPKSYKIYFHNSSSIFQVKS